MKCILLMSVFKSNIFTMSHEKKIELANLMPANQPYIKMFLFVSSTDIYAHVLEYKKDCII